MQIATGAWRAWRRALRWALPMIVAALPVAAQSVTAYHGGVERSGNFVMPGLGRDEARALRLVAGFAPRFAGKLYAQPLFWHPPGAVSGMLLAASESNTVAAIDAASGSTLWTRTLGPPAPRSALPCGNIDPLGITGTPVIDAARGAVYLDAVIDDASGIHHRLFALSLKDGALLAGWPIDVAAGLRAQGQAFADAVQNQRGALAILDNTLYVPFGGHFGDCGDYRGWVVGVPLDDPHRLFAWRTRGRGGGIWAPGGIAGDRERLYVATGNTVGAQHWSDGEAVFRLAPDLHHSERPEDFFAAPDWRALDTRDADLGGANPLPLDLPTGGGTQPLLLALGKDERGYLLDRRRLGGIGGSLLAERVATFPIRTAPAAYPGGDGVFVAFQGAGSGCPAGQRGLTALKIRAGTPPSMAPAWCAALAGAGSAMVTTTDGSVNPVVWILGAEGDNRLHGFRGDTGEPLLSGPPLAGLRHFATPIAADGRLYVGADGRLYAFAVAR